MKRQKGKTSKRLKVETPAGRVKYRKCQLCGRRIRKSNLFGVCKHNRKCRREYARRWRAANLERARDCARRAVARREGRNELFCRSQTTAHGHRHRNWRGGYVVECAVPGCYRKAGWRTPSQQRKNKTGFRCPEHRHVRLPTITEEDYEYPEKPKRKRRREAD